MKKKVNLHLLHESMFTEAYITFINENFIPNSHMFLIYQSDHKFKLHDANNIIRIDKEKNKWKLLNKYLYQANKVIIHSLFEQKIILLLFIQPWLLKKMFWVVWGADLYQYRDIKVSTRAKLFERIRKFVIKNMGNICTLVYGDYVLAKKWYGFKGRYFEAMYISNDQGNHMHDFKNIIINNTSKESIVKILIGNSASQSNNHLEVFKKLEKFKDYEIEFICPLSYGNMEYGKLVIESGYKSFGDKFVPLTEILSYEKYFNLLKSIDIGIFNNDRQQALGNIFVLLELGKKIYMRNDTSMWNEIKNDLDIDVFDIKNIELETIDEMLNFDLNLRLNNVKKIKDYRSSERIIQIWSNIFSS